MGLELSSMVANSKLPGQAGCNLSTTQREQSLVWACCSNFGGVCSITLQRLSVFIKAYGLKPWGGQVTKVIEVRVVPNIHSFSRALSIISEPGVQDAPFVLPLSFQIRHSLHERFRLKCLGDWNEPNLP